MRHCCFNSGIFGTAPDTFWTCRGLLCRAADHLPLRPIQNHKYGCHELGPSLNYIVSLPCQQIGKCWCIASSRRSCAPSSGSCGWLPTSTVCFIRSRSIRCTCCSVPGSPETSSRIRSASFSHGAPSWAAVSYPAPWATSTVSSTSWRSTSRYCWSWPTQLTIGSTADHFGYCLSLSFFFFNVLYSEM